MQATLPKLLDTIALLADRPDADLKSGQIGTIVEFLGRETAEGWEAYEVEFCDKEGCAVHFTALRRDEFLVLLPAPEGLAV